MFPFFSGPFYFYGEFSRPFATWSRLNFDVAERNFDEWEERVDIVDIVQQLNVTMRNDTCFWKEKWVTMICVVRRYVSHLGANRP